MKLQKREVQTGKFKVFHQRSAHIGAFSNIKVLFLLLNKKTSELSSNIRIGPSLVMLEYTQNKLVWNTVVPLRA